MTERCVNLTQAEARAWAAGATALIRPVHSRDGGHPDIYDMKWRDGDVLIGREAWCHPADDDARIDESKAMFAVDTPDAVLVDGDGFTVFTRSGAEASPWRSPATMPAALARHRRRVVSVRVCRGLDLTYDECRAALWNPDGWTTTNRGPDPSIGGGLRSIGVTSPDSWVSVTTMEAT